MTLSGRSQSNPSSEGSGNPAEEEVKRWEELEIEDTKKTKTLHDQFTEELTEAVASYTGSTQVQARQAPSTERAKGHRPTSISQALFPVGSHL